MLYIGLAISYSYMFVAFVSFDPTLNADYFIFQKELHTQQVLHINLSLFELNWLLMLFALIRFIINIFVMLALRISIYTLESNVLLS